MKWWTLVLPLAAFASALAAAKAWPATSDAGRGQHVFQACAACHSLESNQNMTGPSLADLWGRKAGSLASFPRYSSALKSSGVVWNDKTLDDWIKDPQHFIPGNDMTFEGIKDDQPRADLLVYLKKETQPGHPPSQMSGMMGGGAVNLKTVGPEHRVRAISFCEDTFRVTTADSNTRAFWERNLRLKVDSSASGPEKGAPVLVGAGMMGDRADVIFADPSEISAFIANKC